MNPQKVCPFNRGVYNQTQREKGLLKGRGEYGRNVELVLAVSECPFHDIFKLELIQ